MNMTVKLKTEFDFGKVPEVIGPCAVTQIRLFGKRKKKKKLACNNHAQDDKT